MLMRGVCVCVCVCVQERGLTASVALYNESAASKKALKAELKAWIADFTKREGRAPDAKDKEVMDRGSTGGGGARLKYS